jgi:hypothetical protein
MGWVGGGGEGNGHRDKVIGLRLNLFQIHNKGAMSAHTFSF